jgi:hypothetical protein
MSPMAWARTAACHDRLELPWTEDGDWSLRVEVRRMRVVCASCPVLRACATYAEEEGICGGFWAGEWRTEAKVLARHRLARDAA